MNPIDLLGVDPHGAHEKPVDPRNYQTDSLEVGMAAAPFDWSTGYDVEEEMGYALPTKDQGSSGSCGGQTLSAFQQVLSSLYLSDPTEKSAKAPYSQVFAPGGGSNSFALGELFIKQGMYQESSVPSYPALGVPPNEDFMERSQDISTAARLEAKKTAGLFAYSFPKLGLDAMAAAAKTYKGILIGIHGSNNGTWLSPEPSAQAQGPFWSHFMYGGKPQILNGKKGIWAKQSWGNQAAPATNNWQFLSEDHWASGRIWDAMVFHFSPVPPKPTHVFAVDLHYGQTSSEIGLLQAALANEGCFNLAPTNYYGDITARAVLKFRVKHGIDSSTDPSGHVVGPRTRGALNSI